MREDKEQREFAKSLSQKSVSGEKSYTKVNKIALFRIVIGIVRPC